MDDQAKVSEHNGSPSAASKGLVGDVGEFAHDVLTLAELQAQLFAADLRQCRQHVLVPSAVLLAGAALGLACFPIALAAAALLVIEIFETTAGSAFLLVAVIGAVISALVCVIGWIGVRRRLAVMQRSKQELVRNLRWIKKVLKRTRITRKKHSLDNSWRTVT
jgi:hypothetical protein